jgi:hypothetical protein
VAMLKILEGVTGVKRWDMAAAAVIAAVLVVQVGSAVAEDATGASKPKHTIKDVMKGAYKGDASLRSKIAAGTATPAQKAQFLELTEALAANKPPKGDAAAWDAKVAALVKVSRDLLDGRTAAAAPDAAKLAAFKTASDCKACHTAHKGN